MVLSSSDRQTCSRHFCGVVGFDVGQVWRLVGCGSHNNRGQADRFSQCRVCGEMPQALHRYNLPLTTVVMHFVKLK